MKIQNWKNFPWIFPLEIQLQPTIFTINTFVLQKYHTIQNREKKHRKTRIYFTSLKSRCMCILVCNGAAPKLINNARSIQLYRVENSSQDYTESYTYRAYECIAHFIWDIKHTTNTPYGYMDLKPNEIERRHGISMKLSIEKGTRIGRVTKTETARDSNNKCAHVWRDRERKSER